MKALCINVLSQYQIYATISSPRYTCSIYKYCTNINVMSTWKLRAPPSPAFSISQLDRIRSVMASICIFPCNLQIIHVSLILSKIILLFHPYLNVTYLLYISTILFTCNFCKSTSTYIIQFAMPQTFQIYLNALYIEK